MITYMYVPCFTQAEKCGDLLEVDIDKQHGEDKTITNDVAP